MNKAFSFTKESATDQSPEETQAIMSYELGHVIEYHLKAKRYGESVYYSNKNQQKEMSDLISMCRYYCEQKGWDFEVLCSLGEQAYLDRMEDIRKYGVVKK